jgi:hypothetical protein
MKVLKGLGLGVTGFLLFLALIILGIAVAVNSTLLNPQFMIDEIEKLDINTAAQQILQETLPSEAAPYLPAIIDTFAENKVWISSQVEYSINRFYDYILGRTSTFSIEISTEQFTQGLFENLTETYAQLPPSEQGLPLDQIQQQIAAEIPSTIRFTQENIPSDAWQTIQQAKEIVGLTRTIYIGLIIFSLALIALIILITRRFKSATLSLGIIFLVAGVANLSALIITQQVAPGSIPLGDLPTQIQIWLKQVIIDYITPWKIYSMVVLVLGILLLTTSFFLFRQQAQKSEIA